MGADAAPMPLISSCNIACGGHAGTPETMAASVQLARQNGVAIGAHPAYPDPDNFGRSPMAISNSDLQSSLTQQIATLAEIAAHHGAAISHIKPHGALYNEAAKSADLANLIAAVAQGTMPNASLVGPPHSALTAAAENLGLRFIAEGFADRTYLADGSLTPRSQPGAVIEDHETQLAQALKLAAGTPLPTHNGKTLTLEVQTLCVHGDTPGAVEAAAQIRAALEAAGHTIAAPA